MHYVYILTNINNNVLYIGMTNNMVRRLYEHNNPTADSFTARYNVHKLVFCENCSDVNDAIAREKQLKGWVRKKKIALIEKYNPEWVDLAKEWQ